MSHADVNFAAVGVAHGLDGEVIKIQLGIRPPAANRRRRDIAGNIRCDRAGRRRRGEGKLPLALFEMIAGENSQGRPNKLAAISWIPNSAEK